MNKERKESWQDFRISFVANFNFDWVFAIRKCLDLPVVLQTYYNCCFLNPVLPHSPYDILYK